MVCIRIPDIANVIIIILTILTLFSSVYIPEIVITDNKAGLIVPGVILGILGGGFLEELGWTGFAVPRLRMKYSVLKTGLITGLLWALWHFLPVLWGSGDADGNLDLAQFLPALFCHYTVLIAYRVLLVWLHDCTKSLIPVMLMHASLTMFINFIFRLNSAAAGFSLLIYFSAVAIALWGMVGIAIDTIKKSQKII